jgi:tetratricopeptide (TPR) repeat protein
MKRFFLGTLLVLFTLTITTAQEYKKQLKTANKTLSKYYVDPVLFTADLKTALATIDQAFTNDLAKADPEAWITKGQIFNEIAKSEMNKKVVDSTYTLSTPKAGMIALEAFEKAMSIAAKKSQTKDALEGIRLNEDFTNNIAITHFQVQDYENAYINFAATLKAHDILKANKAESRIDDPTMKNEQVFYTAATAFYGKNKEAAIPLFEELAKGPKAQSLVYEALFTHYAEKDINKAMTYMEAGRAAHPDDNGLLFAEINYYLKIGKLDVLTDKLKAAIQKEPDNISVYNTLGNVYDQLNQKERAAANNIKPKYILGPKDGCYFVKENGEKQYVDKSMCDNEPKMIAMKIDSAYQKADEYFKLAYSYFEQALSKDPKNFDAIYSQGALYYNKAASMTARLNELSNDFSSAGTKKYNAIKAEMDGYFKEALPFFLKAEQIDGKDQNTMIALKEIYARQGDLAKSNMYKEKLEGGSK